MATTDPVIREMKRQDIPDVMEIENVLFPDPWPESIFHDDIVSPFGYPFVAQINNEIVGYAIVWLGVEEAHLTNIAVIKKFQRKSIAKELLSHILSLVADTGLAQILLEVRPSNTPAISLYESFGFERLTIQKDYYRSPHEDCLLMRKKL